MTIHTVTPNSWIGEPIAAEDAAGPATPAINDIKRKARIAGVLYLLLGVFGGFAQGFIGPKMYAAGDAATTALNVATNPVLVRVGVVAELAGQVFFIFLALALYGLLKHVHQGVARAMVVLVALAAGIVSLNAVFLFESLQLVTNSSYIAAWGADGVNAMVLLMLDLQHYGLLIGQIFFGLWLAPLGYLAFRSGLFPRALAGVLVLGAICYLLDLLAAFLAPEVGQVIHGYVVIPCVVAEIWMVLYLLVIGVRTPKTSAPLAAA